MVYLLLTLLLLFFILLAIQPRGRYAKIFLIITSMVGVVFILLDYASIASADVKIKPLPFFLEEEHGSFKVLSLDWAQVVGLCIILNIALYYKYRKIERKGEDAG